MQLTRAARWTNYFDTLYEVEKSSVPFPDDPPIVYPAAPIWEELTNRRKDRYGSMDLKATGEAEKNIEKALRSPLHSTGLDFVETPLNDVVNQLQEDYGIPIQLDTTGAGSSRRARRRARDRQLAQRFAAFGAAADAQEPAADVHHSGRSPDDHHAGRGREEIGRESLPGGRSRAAD